MNYSIIFYILGWICIFQTGFMALPCLVAVIYGEREIIGFLLSMLICLVIGVPLVLRKPKMTKKSCMEEILFLLI